jgi:hypothetical protein
MRYFKKIYPQQKLILSNGKGFTFTEVREGFGVLATENPVLLKEFDLAIAAKKGGIIEITATEFEDLKKKQPGRGPNHNEAIQPSKAAAARAAARRNAEPAEGGESPLIQRSFKTPDPARRLDVGNKRYRPGTVDR